MKLFWHRLSFWWFTTMVPAYGSLNTVDARETLRKRRLFSIILLIAILTGVLFAIQYSLNGTIFLQEATSIVSLSIPLGALWINRCGYLKCAGSFYLFLILLTAFMSIFFLSLKIPILALYTWPTLILLPVVSGLFLPSWAPILLSLLEIVFMCWFVQYGGLGQIALFIHDTQSQVQFLFYICVLIVVAMALSIIYATTTKNAVMQADRTVELEQAYAKLEMAHATIQKQAMTDGLTGLPNHGAIVELIELELQQCRAEQRNCAILFVDVDHFKCINDTLGHAAGDAALRVVGQRLRHGIRKNDHVGRYGGEEFAILLSNIKQPQALDLADHLRRSIADVPCTWQREETCAAISLPLTASFGLATYPLDGLTARELLNTADMAMYAAKHTGRNRIGLPNEACLAQFREDESQSVSQSGEQNVLQLMTMMAAFHDQGTQEHAIRMVRLAEATMRMMGRSEDEVGLLRMATQMHDIGKIGVPSAILQKPGPLTEDEWKIMRRHPQIGQQILTQARGPFELIAHIVVAHHERWDGQGYPYQLAQQEIPLGARILSVVDAYDAMTSSRPYRKAHPAATARAELRQGAGHQFDPQVVEAFLRVLQVQEPLPMHVIPVTAFL